MTDKVQKIRKEVQRLQDLTMDENKNFYSEAAEGEYNALCNIEHFIDSLQEDPCNHCQGHNNKEECDALVFGHNCPIVKKPVNEDLEKAAIVYNKKAVTAHNKRVNFVVAGYVPNEHFIAGAKWQEQQMMSKAINAQCFGFQDAALFSFRLPADNYLVGSEIKVIVIKED